MKVEVGYADALSMTRVQLTELEAIEYSHGSPKGRAGVALMSGTAATYWTEHSPRSTLASWVSCLGTFPADWPDLLGRWGAGRAEGYVRTHRRRVHLMQEAVAEKFRSSRNPHVLFDEDALFTDLREYLMRKGLAEPAARDQVERLIVKGKLDEEADAEEADRSAEGSTVEISDGEVVPITEVSKHGVVQVEELMGQYVVSVVANRRRLHRIGNCYRIPGIDYANFEVLGEGEPDRSLYTSWCQFCWRGQGQAATAEAARSSSASGSSSSSSSSEPAAIVSRT